MNKPNKFSYYRGQFFSAFVILFTGLSVGILHADDSPGLFEAVQEGDITNVQALLANGANVNATNNLQQTPLFACFLFRSDRKSIEEMLIAKGADVSAKDDSGMTPLFYAAQLGLTNPPDAVNPPDVKSEIEYLITHGANINARDDDGGTPLFMASDDDMANFLIAQGADATVKNSGGMTAEQVREYQKKHPINVPTF